jgi:hypothetical protein
MAGVIQRESVPMAGYAGSAAARCTRFGATPRLLRKHRAWQAGYWGASLGPADAQPLVDDLRRQGSHHDDSHHAEQWQFNGQGESANGGL